MLLRRAIKPGLAILVLLLAMTAGGGGARPALSAPPNDATADHVIGLPDGVGGGCSGTPSASNVCVVWDSAMDAAGNLFVADTQRHRVLVFLSVATTDTVADVVFGQGGSFTSGTCNSGGITAASLCSPSGVALDGTGNLYISDSGNGRVLVYTTPLVDQTADLAIGQGGSFTTNTIDACGGQTVTTASKICSPDYIAVAPDGTLYVSDNITDRVLGYDPPLATDRIADYVFGRAGSFTDVGALCGVSPVSSTITCNPDGVAVNAAGDLYVADTVNHRVLKYVAPKTDFVADLVFGQGDAFTTRLCGGGAAGMCFPRDIAAVGQDVFISDSSNNRVLGFVDPAATDRTADAVLGQPNYVTSFASGGRPGLWFPNGLYADNVGSLYVADVSNYRLAIYHVPLATDAMIDRVIGVPSAFNSSACNTGGTPSAGGLCTPDGVVLDAAGNVYVADRLNSRVLEYNTPLTTDYVADRVFGQAGSFGSGACNSAGLGATSLCNPSAVALDAAGNLIVADTGNNRVVAYADPLTADAVADVVFGQVDFVSSGCGLSDSELCSPQGVVVDSDNSLYIADASNHRVLEFDGGLGGDATADRVIGQVDFVTGTCNAGGGGPATLCSPRGLASDATKRLVVADSTNNRVLRYDDPIANDSIADTVYGQPSFTVGTCNNGGLSLSSLCGPRNVHVASTGEIYISDYGNHRVLRYASGTTAAFAFNAAAGCNLPGPVQSAKTLCHPLGVATDTTGRLWIADGDNSRVLEYDVMDDIDEDGIGNASDNCPTVANPSQANDGDRNFVDNSPPYVASVDDKTRANSDPVADACDEDADNDGILNSKETAGPPCATASLPTNPMLADTDGDRFLDGAECALSTNPAAFASKPLVTACGATTDTDGDKLADRVEFCFYGTSPISTDSDGDRTIDGAKDGCEAASFNGDRIVNVADMGMLATAISNPAFRIVNVDVNKDGAWNPADQGIVASFISPAGQCPG